MSEQQLPTKFSWKWLGIFFGGIALWILIKGVAVAYATNFLVPVLKMEDYVFSLFAMLTVVSVTMAFYFYYQKFHPNGFAVFFNSSEYLKDVLIGVIIAVLSVAIVYFLVIPIAGEDDPTISFVKNLVHSGPLINIILAGVLIGGIAEELFFRGHLIESFRRAFPYGRWSLVAAIIISALLFGLGHRHQGTLGMVFSGVHSVVWAALFINRRSLIAPMVGHGLYDTLMTLCIKFLL